MGAKFNHQSLLKAVFSGCVNVFKRIAIAINPTLDDLLNCLLTDHIPILEHIFNTYPEISAFSKANVGEMNICNSHSTSPARIEFLANKMGVELSEILLSFDNWDNGYIIRRIIDSFQLLVQKTKKITSSNAFYAVMSYGYRVIEILQSINIKIELEGELKVLHRNQKLKEFLEMKKIQQESQ